jgi:hypothetical protein
MRMGFLDGLKRLFGLAAGGGDSGIYYYIRCDRCGDFVRIRLNPTSELQQEFSTTGDFVRGYYVRKMVVDQRCFRPIEVELRFDSRRRETSREITGGQFVDADAYAAGRSGQAR